jgi:hypothetical protein
MKRKYLLICFAFYLISLLVVTVFAHPGRADSNGGHTDHSTGEYHYHHGYSAHDHYDMDGDGVLDCPYDFVDKTENHSGSSYTSSTNKYSKSETTPQLSTSKENVKPNTATNRSTKEQKKFILDFLGTVILLFFAYGFAQIISLFICHLISYIIKLKDHTRNILYHVLYILLFVYGACGIIYNTYF